MGTESNYAMRVKNVVISRDYMEENISPMSGTEEFLEHTHAIDILLETSGFLGSWMDSFFDILESAFEDSFTDERTVADAWSVTEHYVSSALRIINRISDLMNPNGVRFNYARPIHNVEFELTLLELSVWNYE